LATTDPFLLALDPDIRATKQQLAIGNYKSVTCKWHSQLATITLLFPSFDLAIPPTNLFCREAARGFAIC
jgi:hypothetical protein